jgi:hypothetical protein
MRQTNQEQNDLFAQVVLSLRFIQAGHGQISSIHHFSKHFIDKVEAA